jgi:hypothetical protein
MHPTETDWMTMRRYSALQPELERLLAHPLGKRVDFSPNDLTVV